jgi:hypothetical protein
MKPFTTFVLASFAATVAAQGPCEGGPGGAYLTTTPAIAGGSLVMNAGSPASANGISLLVFGNDAGPQFPACLDTIGMLIVYVAALDASGNAQFNFGIPGGTAMSLGPIFAKAIVLEPTGVSLSKTVRVSVEVANSYRELPPLASVRSMHTVTAFELDARDNRTGAILIGGATGTLVAPTSLSDTARFDSLTRMWTAGPTLAVPRSSHRCVRLADGRILVTGGMINAPVGTGGPATSSCEIYDPATNTLSATGSMLQPRMGHCLNVLPDGRVFASGGFADWTDAGPNFAARLNTATNTTELWIPTTGTWTAGPTMNAPRAGHTQTPLGGGRLLLVCGVNGGRVHQLSGSNYQMPTFTSTCEIFDAATNSFSPAAAGSARGFHAASALANGGVLMTGGAMALGSNGAAIAVGTTLVYFPATDTWAGATTLPTAVAFHTQIEHAPSGDAIIMGGFTGDFTTLSGTSQAVRHNGISANLLAYVGYHPSLAYAFLTVGQHAVCRLHDGTILMTGGFVGWSGTSTITSRSLLYVP